MAWRFWITGGAVQVRGADSTAGGKTGSGAGDGEAQPAAIAAVAARIPIEAFTQIACAKRCRIDA
jgi:hypothetical protein